MGVATVIPKLAELVEFKEFADFGVPHLAGFS